VIAELQLAVLEKLGSYVVIFASSSR